MTREWRYLVVLAAALACRQAGPVRALAFDETPAKSPAPTTKSESDPAGESSAREKYTLAYKFRPKRAAFVHPIFQKRTPNSYDPKIQFIADDVGQSDTTCDTSFGNYQGSCLEGPACCYCFRESSLLHGSVFSLFGPNV
jgi:hypothetical protein